MHKVAKTKNNIGMDKNGKDLSNKILTAINRPQDLCGNDWFEIHTDKYQLGNFNIDISKTLNEINLEFVSRIKKSRGTDFNINPDKCVLGVIEGDDGIYAFLLDELEDISPLIDVGQN